MEKEAEEQHLTAEDQVFILMQAGLYLTTMRGIGIPEARSCYERAELLCQSLDRPRLQYVAVVGQWRYSLVTDNLSSALEIATRVYSLAQEENDAALIMGACRPMASTVYFLGDFESALQYATCAVQIWRSGKVQFPVEEICPRQSFA